MIDIFRKNIFSENKNDEWKLRNIPKVLKGEALKYFINECFECINFKEVAKFLTERFIKAHIPRFSYFASLKLHDFSDLEDYFHKKLEIGRQL